MRAPALRVTSRRQQRMTLDNAMGRILYHHNVQEHHECAHN
jgi:hypothetical protein